MCPIGPLITLSCCGGGGRGEERVEGCGGVGRELGCDAHVLGEEALETELVGVAVEVCFAGGFPEDAVCEEFGLGCGDEGVEAGFPGCVAVGLQNRLDVYGGNFTKL